MRCLIDKPARVYRPRQPAESDFHRLIRQHFDDFRAVYAEHYARKLGHWRPVFDRAVRQFLKCGDLQHGFLGCVARTADTSSSSPFPASSDVSAPVARGSG